MLALNPHFYTILCHTAMTSLDSYTLSGRPGGNNGGKCSKVNQTSAERLPKWKQPVSSGRNCQLSTFHMP